MKEKKAAREKKKKEEDADNLYNSEADKSTSSSYESSCDEKEEKKKGNNQESVCIDILRNFTCIHRPSVFQHLFVVGFCQRQSSPPTHKWRSVEGLLILPCIGRHCTIVWRPARKLWRGTFIWSSWTSTLGIKLQT